MPLSLFFQFLFFYSRARAQVVFCLFAFVSGPELVSRARGKKKERERERDFRSGEKKERKKQLRSREDDDAKEEKKIPTPSSFFFERRRLEGIRANRPLLRLRSLISLHSRSFLSAASIVVSRPRCAKGRNLKQPPLRLQPCHRDLSKHHQFVETFRP